jgi:soluble lytic murein transglycosylase-like protein
MGHVSGGRFGLQLAGRFVGGLVGCFLLLAANSASAEIALLTNGKTLKVAAYRVEGEDVTLSLKGGGEVTTPVSMLQGILPDEVMDEVLASIGAATNLEELRTLAAETARRHGLDPALVLAVAAVESAFQPKAVSPKGAQGLMQLMPATAADLGVQDAFDPADNLDGGSRHLAALLTQYGGDVAKALAAYNAGAGAVKRHHGIPPYRETQDYVKRVLRRYEKEQ